MPTPIIGVEEKKTPKPTINQIKLKIKTRRLNGNRSLNCFKTILKFLICNWKQNYKITKYKQKPLHKLFAPILLCFYKITTFKIIYFNLFFLFFLIFFIISFLKLRLWQLNFLTWGTFTATSFKVLFWFALFFYFNKKLV